MLIRIATFMACTGIAIFGAWAFWNFGLMFGIFPPADIELDAYLGFISAGILIFLWCGGMLLMVYGIEIEEKIESIKNGVILQIL